MFDPEKYLEENLNYFVPVENSKTARIHFGCVTAWFSGEIYLRTHPTALQLDDVRWWLAH